MPQVTSERAEPNENTRQVEVIIIIFGSLDISKVIIYRIQGLIQT